MGLSRKFVVGFNAEKSQLVLFGRSNNTNAIDVKMNGSVFEEESFFEDAAVDFLF